VLAARRFGAKTFLHESNTIPGRANRWLARWVDQAFVGFPQAEGRLAARSVVVTGTPVRADFQTRDAAESRLALGLEANRPVLLVMGGSQGASGVNDLIVNSLPALARHALQWQWLHLAGPNDVEKVQRAYARHEMKAVVRPFLSEMELALAAATASVSRAGASSLAELAALRLPALLVPFPVAADNHQWHNARAFEETGAAQLLEQRQATPEKISQALRELMEDTEERKAIKAALARWHAPKAAQLVADRILQSVSHAASMLELPTPDESPAASVRNRSLSEDVLVA
jgi:UDP-N-acetylglucosamine--N-acetylmuramyl-(pentapeptide) pyrophosphoryl-undecaprenol N-acetylglucosamine transferase